MKGRAEGRAAGRGQGPQGQAVIGFPAGDEPYLLGASHGQMNLAGQFDGRLHGLAPAGQKIEALYASRGVPAKSVGQILHHLGAEHAGVGVIALLQLLLHGLGDLTAAVAHVDHHRPAAGVQIFFTFFINDPNPLSLSRLGQGTFQLAPKHMARAFTHDKTLYSEKRFKCNRSGFRKKVDCFTLSALGE